MDELIRWLNEKIEHNNMEKIGSNTHGEQQYWDGKLVAYKSVLIKIKDEKRKEK